MSLNKKYKIVIGVLIGIVIVMFAASIIISNLVNSSINRLLTTQNIKNYHVSIDNSKFSLFDRSMVLTGIHLSPTDTAMTSLKKSLPGKNALHKISITRLKLKGIHLFPIIFSKKININTLILDNPLYQKFSNGREVKSKEKTKPLNLDSLQIKNIHGFQLNKIKITNLKIQTIDIMNNEIEFENEPFDFQITGFRLDEIEDELFKLSPNGEAFEVSNLKVIFPEKNYSFSIAGIRYLYEENQLHIKNLKYAPLINKVKLASSYKYNSDVYDVAVNEINIFNLALEKIIENKGYVMDSIQINELDLDIYKDKRKPFDINKRPKLPHEVIKEMSLPLLIRKITVKNSKLVYEERLENKDILMKVTMNDISANLNNITNMPTRINNPLELTISTKFMGKANLFVNMTFPLEKDKHTFYFNGNLGTSQMRYYDSAIIPALGLKVLKGKIENLSFKASADSNSSKGTMKMLYHDLEAEVFKPKNTEKSGFLSWSVNNLVHRSNPGNKGKIREATMNHERVIYKGFGNLIWKTLQSGIVNTIAPFGMTKEKQDNKKRRQQKRDKRRQK